MKTLKLFMFAFMICLFGSSFAQTTKSAAKAEDKKSVYFVQVPHTKEQCLDALVEMKDKGDALLSKFDYGCMSGDHTAYGFLEATSEENVKTMLPSSELKSARIVKVHKFTVADIEKMHKDHM
ncbi:MAG TPA: hypothetical protein VJ203_06100 [Bacteroidales bacterium]|nr:hypothetical protein [Bacteroidales bacterium]